MDEVIIHAVNPVVDYVFGGFCLMLMIAMGLLLWYGIRAWRSDIRSWGSETRAAAAKFAELTQATATVISNNSASNDKLSTSLDKVAQHQDDLTRRLLSRPCLKNGIERE